MRTGVIQPLPGIGDMTWLLPALSSIAASAPDGKITLFTRASAQADKLLAAEPWLRGIVLLPRARGIFAGGVNLAKTWQALRKAHIDRLYILHKSTRYQIAAKLAGIPEIISYPRDLAKTKEYGWAKSLVFMDQLRIPVADRHARLRVQPENIAFAQKHFAAYPQPWFVVSPGASEVVRCWPPDRFAACADALADMLRGTVFLTGAPREAERVNAVHHLCKNAARIVPVTTLSFDQLMGLLASSLGILGNDSGPTNVAAVLGRPAFVLYGVTPPVPHSPNLLHIMPDISESHAEGMERISVQHVLDFIQERLPQFARSA